MSVKLKHLNLTFELKPPFERVEISGDPADPVYSFKVKGGVTLCFKVEQLKDLKVSIDQMIALVLALSKNVPLSDPRREVADLNEALLQGTIGIGQHGIAAPPEPERMVRPGVVVEEIPARPMVHERRVHVHAGGPGRVAAQAAGHPGAPLGLHARGAHRTVELGHIVGLEDCVAHRLAAAADPLDDVVADAAPALHPAHRREVQPDLARRPGRPGAAGAAGGGRQPPAGAGRPAARLPERRALPHRRRGDHDHDLHHQPMIAVYTPDFEDQCVGCNMCEGPCPNAAITNRRDSIQINDKRCQGCSTCITVCPNHIIHVMPVSEVISDRDAGWCVETVLNRRAWPSDTRCRDRCAGCGHLYGEEVYCIRRDNRTEALAKLLARGVAQQPASDLIADWFEQFSRVELAVQARRPRRRQG